MVAFARNSGYNKSYATRGATNYITIRNCLKIYNNFPPKLGWRRVWFYLRKNKEYLLSEGFRCIDDFYNKNYNICIKIVLCIACHYDKLSHNQD